MKKWSLGRDRGCSCIDAVVRRFALGGAGQGLTVAVAAGFNQLSGDLQAIVIGTANLAFSLVGMSVNLRLEWRDAAWQ